MNKILKNYLQQSNSVIQKLKKLEKPFFLIDLIDINKKSLMRALKFSKLLELNILF